MNNTIQNTARAAAFFLCGAIAFGALQVSAQAADYALPTRKVSYADLDISKPAGAQVLYRRIVAAARQVCAFDGSKDLAVLLRSDKCVDHAIDNAVKEVGSPALSALRPNAVIHFASID